MSDLRPTGVLVDPSGVNVSVPCFPSEVSHDWQESGYCLQSAFDFVAYANNTWIPVIPVQVCNRCGLIRVEPKEVGM